MKLLLKLMLITPDTSAMATINRALRFTQIA